MSRKLKAIICALTAGMMLFTSTGLSVFAEELNADGSAAATETKLNADGSEAVATEQPETVGGADVAEDEKDADVVADIAASQATQEPEATPVPKGYDADTYYQNALQVTSGLGIITGYDDGSVKPESTVTRAEMATIILRMIAAGGTSAYQNVFTDVSSDHWAADTIQTAVELSIVDGMGDGTFVPDGPVKYEQVIKMIVCAMNYGIDAENAGGYPNGYLSVGGGTLKLLTGVTGAAGSDMPRGEVIKAVYNALKASYRDIKEFKNGYPVYTAKDTLGIEKFKMYEEEGVLTTTPNLTIASGSKTKDGVITIDGVDYKCDFNVDKFVASKIKFYYIDDNSDDNRVIALFSMGKSRENTFKDVDINEINTSAGTLKAYTSSTSSSTKTYKINNATVVYNDTIMTTADFNKYIGSSAITYDEFIKPHVGDVRIVDYDDDGTYDIIFVNSYETMLVTNATSDKVTGKINNTNTTIEYDVDDSSYEIHVKKNDVEASVKNLKKNDVASIKRNLEGDKLTIVVTGENITGTISGTGEEDDEMTITVNGQEYKVDENVSKKYTEPGVTDLKSGVTGTFYLDQFDRIGYADLESTLVEGENYAMITKAFYNDEEELVIRLFTQDGKEIEAKPASSMQAWLPGAESASRPSETQLINALSDDSRYVQAVNGASSYPVKLCTYKMNNAGEITKLYVAVGTSTTTSSSALTVYDGNGTKKANLRDVGTVGGALQGYTIEDGIVEFNVPDDATERNSGANYSAGTVSASGYKNYEGVSTDFAIGSFVNSRYPQVLIHFTTSTNSTAKIGDVDTASIQPAMIVSKVNEAVDDEGETVFVITGYSAGSEVSYTTTKNTGLYKFTGFDGGAEYKGTLLYDPSKDSASKFQNNLRQGDIIVMKVNNGYASVVIKMTDVEDVAKAAVGDTSSGLLQLPSYKSAKNSNTRESYYMGFVSNVVVEDSAFIDLTSYDGSAKDSVTYNASTVFSDVTITVNESGKITNTKIDKNGGIEANELEPLEGSGDTEFDYAVFTGLKGGMNNGYIVKVVLDIE